MALFRPLWPTNLVGPINRASVAAISLWRQISGKLTPGPRTLAAYGARAVGRHFVSLRHCDMI